MRHASVLSRANAGSQRGDAGICNHEDGLLAGGQCWLGYLEEFPDFWTQGETVEDLKEHVRDLHADLTSGELLGVRRVADLTLA